MRVGDFIYAFNGDFGPAFFTAIAAKTGQIVWQERGFAKASFLYADGKFIILDEEGQLALATPSATGLQVNAKVEIFRLCFAQHNLSYVAFAVMWCWARKSIGCHKPHEPAAT